MKYFLCLLLAFFLSVSRFAPTVANQVPPAQTDITFVVAGKTGNFRQSTSGQISALNYHFFAEIFLQEHGKIKQAGLLTPDNLSEAVAFSNSGYAFEMHGGRYPSEIELERYYPDGNYIFRYDTPSTGLLEQTISLVNSTSSSSRLPDAPHITLSQNGKAISPDQLQENLPLTVTWSAFKQGNQDPLGIVNDLVFVIMANCHGKRVSHSGRPFENTSYLDYTSTEFIIPAELLLPDNAYQLSVEHAILDTTLSKGVPGLATFATTTFLDIMTLGSATGETACKEILKNFDGGQTDLKQRHDETKQYAQ
ncbi:MAG: hypothetical protein P8J18_01390 [Halieaceae bacterium]|nr:hypothetical protein [Halieaceae bacterium]